MVSQNNIIIRGRIQSEIFRVKIWFNTPQMNRFLLYKPRNALTFRLPRGYPPPTFFAYHTFCIWNKILTFEVAVGGPFAHIQRYKIVMIAHAIKKLCLRYPRCPGGGYHPPRLSNLTYLFVKFSQKVTMPLFRGNVRLHFHTF